MFRELYHRLRHEAHRAAERFERAEHGVEVVYLGGIVMDVHGVHVVAAGLMLALLVLVFVLHYLGE